MKRTMHLLVTTMLAAAVPWTSPAFAEDDDRFAKLDTNKDGFLSSYEAGAQSGLIEMFSKLDTDQDGALSKEEWKASVHRDRDQNGNE